MGAFQLESASHFIKFDWLFKTERLKNRGKLKSSAALNLDLNEENHAPISKNQSTRDRGQISSYFASADRSKISLPCYKSYNKIRWCLSYFILTLAINTWPLEALTALRKVENDIHRTNPSPALAPNSASIAVATAPSSSSDLSRLKQNVTAIAVDDSQQVASNNKVIFDKDGFEGTHLQPHMSSDISEKPTEALDQSESNSLEPLVTAASKKKKKSMKKSKKMEKKHKEWKKGKKHKKKKYESKKKKGGSSKKKKGKKEKKKWGMEKKGHKKKGNFKKKKWGSKKKSKKGQKKGKKGHKMLKDKGHKKKGFKKVYHKEEWGKKKKWHDIKREKKWNTKQKKWKKKWHQEKGKKYKGKHMKKYHKKNKHGKKYKKEKKSKWKKHKGEKFKKGHKKKKEEYSKKKEGGKKKKMKKSKKEMKKKKKG